MIGEKKFDLTEHKTLVILLNDNTSNNVKYFIPPKVENIEEIAGFERYVITDEDEVVLDNGIEGRPFEIYHEYGRENLYYLVQRFPVNISNELDFVLKENVGAVNVAKIMRERFFKIMKQVRDQIVRDFEVFILMRFSFTSEPVTTMRYAISRDAKGKIPLVFPNVAPEPMTAFVKPFSTIMTPSLALYFLLPKMKAFLDFSLSLTEITSVVNGRTTFVISQNEYLDNFFNTVIDTIYPLTTL